MARFGAYRWNSALRRYQDRETGQILSFAEVERLQAIARAYGAAGAAVPGIFQRAAETIVRETAQDYDEVLDSIREWSRARAEALERGEDAPAFPSP